MFLRFRSDGIIEASMGAIAEAFALLAPADKAMLLALLATKTRDLSLFNKTKIDNFGYTDDEVELQWNAIAQVVVGRRKTALTEEQRAECKSMVQGISLYIDLYDRERHDNEQEKEDERTRSQDGGNGS